MYLMQLRRKTMQKVDKYGHFDGNRPRIFSNYRDRKAGEVWKNSVGMVLASYNWTRPGIGELPKGPTYIRSGRDTTMLVLSRKVGEKLLIGNNVVVTVLESKGRQIRLGIEAPPSVSVWRGEIESRAQGSSATTDQMAHAN